MANATTADFRNGMVIRYNNDLYIVTEFHHVSPGNWRAFVRTNLKNVRTGRVIERAPSNPQTHRAERAELNAIAAQPKSMQ